MNDADECRALKTDSGSRKVCTATSCNKWQWNGPYAHALLRTKMGKHTCTLCSAEYADNFRANKRYMDGRGADYVSLSAAKAGAEEEGGVGRVAGVAAAASAAFAAAIAGCVVAAHRRRTAALRTPHPTEEPLSPSNDAADAGVKEDIDV